MHQLFSELQKLHQRLVIGGVLSEAEFWTARKHVLEDEAVRLPKQRTGLKSAMLADVRPLTDGRTNKVTFNLTPEIIHQIFAEKPAVHRAFLMHVPSKMSEKDFWTKYCRAEYLYRTKNAAAVAAEAADDEDLAVFVKDDDIIANESRRKIKKVDPTLDMAADLADDYTSIPGHGILRDGSRTSIDGSELQSRKTIMHDLNRHAAVVLDGRPLDAELRDTATVAHALAKTLQAEPLGDTEGVEVEKRRMERVRQMTEIDDLQGPQAPPHSVLYIQDPRKYFEAQQVNGTGGGPATNPSKVDPAEALKTFHQQLNQLKKPNLTSPIIAPDLAFKVLNDLTKYISTTKFHLGKTAEKNVLDNLPRSTKDEILQHSATSNELLRHFWAAYPLTSTFLVEKVNRLKTAMTELYSQLQATKEAVQTEHRHQVSQLLQPIFQALDAAFIHYDTELQKRAARNPQGTSITSGSFDSSNGQFFTGNKMS
ncbi:hypothetical protein O6H91_Y388700 [Diphasiastrum complanatum]|nr:hypothetical protein O6H91_Y388700 [Diphasiastrum complanatum]